MKKDTWHYLLTIAIRDFLESANEVQRAVFVRMHPNFDFKPSIGELYVTIIARLNQLLKFMKKEQIGYFGRVQV